MRAPRTLLTVLALAACQTTPDAATLSGDQLACTTVQFIANPGDEDDAFLQGNDGRRFLLDLRTPGQIVMRPVDPRNGPDTFVFQISSDTGDRVRARHVPPPVNGRASSISNEIDLSPATAQGRTGELRTIFSRQGTTSVNRFIWSCANSGAPF